eukprot:scaffold7310_cov116-Isochrysis_galbana.AAC.8
MDAAEDGLVVNVDHLLEYVKEQKDEGNTAFQAKRYTEALVAWQRGLDAIAQADGKPMHVNDMKLVLVVRSVLHSNRGQALMKMEFWRRAVLDLDEAVRVDPENVKAIWRRCKAHEALKQWSEAEADINLLLEPGLQANTGRLLEAAGLSPEQLQKERARLVEKRERADADAEETFEERAEEAAAKGLLELRERFEEVTARNGLHGNSELATELADMVARPGGVTVEYVANVFQISDEDADILLQWVRKACVMQDALAGRTRVLLRSEVVLGQSMRYMCPAVTTTGVNTPPPPPPHSPLLFASGAPSLRPAPSRRRSGGSSVPACCATEPACGRDLALVVPQYMKRRASGRGSARLPGLRRVGVRKSARTLTPATPSHADAYRTRVAGAFLRHYKFFFYVASTHRPANCLQHTSHTLFGYKLLHTWRGSSRVRMIRSSRSMCSFAHASSRLAEGAAPPSAGASASRDSEAESVSAGVGLSSTVSMRACGRPASEA